MHTAAVFRKCLIVAALLLPTANPPAAAAASDDEEQARREMEALRAFRWANSSEQVLVAPYYRAAAGDSASLILVNRFGRPLSLAISVHGPTGTSFSLAGLEIDARETAQIDLGRSLQGAPVEFREGSLRVSHFGDPEMLQAWVVLSGGKGLLELPLIKAKASDVWRWVAFWDSRLLERGEQLQPRLFFHNTQATEVVVEAAAEPRSGPGTTYRLRIGGGQTATLEPKAHGRWDATSLRIQHDGQPGQVAAIGLLEGHRLHAAGADGARRRAGHG